MVENNAIDMNKTYKTLDGRNVRLLCTDGPHHHYPVIGIIEGSPDTTCWTSTGNYYTYTKEKRGVDLIEVKPRIKVGRWINILKDNVNGNVWLDEYVTHNAAEIRKYSYSKVLARAVLFVWEGEDV